MAHTAPPAHRPRHLARPVRRPPVRALAALVATIPLLTVPLVPVGRSEGLDRGLAQALGQAQLAGLLAGHPFVVTSGRRSVAEQQKLFDEAVVRYGGREEAGRYVLPPERSQHVRGLAADVRPVGGAAWLEREGYRWGLCRRYANETWHFELLTTPGHPCPPMQPDAAG